MYFDNYYGMEEDKDTLRKITTLIMKEIAKLAKTKYSYD
jgi:hypothetical protein